MPLLNYSTTVPVAKTSLEMVKLLGQAKAKTIQLENDHLGNPVGVAFEIHTAHGPRQFQLPIRPGAVGKALWRAYGRGDLPGISAAKAGDPEHARRVAWRQNLDWLRVQLALIESEQVTLEQIFLPYMLVDGRTVYQMIETQQFKMLPASQEVGA